MLFSSYAFLLQFLPVTALGFAAARRHSPRAGVLVLLGASLVFYGAWRPIYLVLLLASIALNFGSGRLMENPARRRAVGMLGVTLNLAALCYFKYTGFILETFGALSGRSLPFAGIVLPLGISFFTFQQIAYLVDIMRGAKAERDIVSYMLFVCFFPHLIAGPLVHHTEMIPQFKRGRSGRSAVLAARGCAIFAAGLFKKVVIADNLAQFVTPVFAHIDAGGGVGTSWGWLAISAYTLQIYFDFSGYSDMAIGLALLFGIRLPVNFRLALQGCLDRRFLAPLAHHAVAFPARLPLHPARRQPARRGTALPQPPRHHAARRPVARRRLEFRDLGRPAWRLSGDQPSLARVAWRQGAGIALHRRCESDHAAVVVGHLFRRRDRMGLLPRQDRSGSVADAARVCSGYRWTVVRTSPPVSFG